MVDGSTRDAHQYVNRRKRRKTRLKQRPTDWINMEDFNDYEITGTMMSHGGGFVRMLGMLFRAADPDNQRKLKGAFPEYWKQYEELSRKIVAIQRID